MIWTSTLETGIKQIDDQHKELFQQADKLLDTKNKERVPETLNFLAKYVIKHFTDEQGMHVASKYPKAEPHKKFHTVFVEQFNKLKVEYETQGRSLPTLIKINNTVVGWLKDHIMVHDKEFAAFYKTRQT